MVKHTKSPPEAPAEGENEPEEASDVAEQALQAALRIVRGDIIAAEGAKPGSARRRAVPKLAGQVVAISCELRKAVKAQAAAAADLTAPLVLAWARQQTREARARLVRELEGIDNPNRRSVLG